MYQRGQIYLRIQNQDLSTIVHHFGKDTIDEIYLIQHNYYHLCCFIGL